MRLKKLVLERFGPFEHYELDFPSEENAFVLLTGRNNEGKSMIINALRLLHGATRVAKRGKTPLVRPLLKKDVEHLNIGRLIYNYEGGTAEIRGVFSNDSEITVCLDESPPSVYCWYSSNVLADISEVFGFIPPFGQLAEDEDLISDEWHLRRSLDTTLAPRHLRNHFRRLSQDQFSLVRTIVRDTWEGIELSHYQYDVASGRLYCLYSEDGVVREIAWAGQGLQVWFQIITHLVRLMNTSILILDEPEVFLHTQKQNDLIQVLREYYDGSVIIATHSVEMMNNVDISHIVNVRKSQTKPKMKSTKDRRFLDRVRSEVGSNFNLIASQFEDIDVLVFTEDEFDFGIVSRLAKALGVGKGSFGVPLGGFSEYPKSVSYRDAYEKFFGKRIEYSVLLDRDYYPQEYLDEVEKFLKQRRIKAIFTPGKEIENVLLDEELLLQMVSPDKRQEFERFLEELFDSEYNNCLGSFLKLHEDFLLGNKKDAKTVLTLYKPVFDSAWNNRGQRLSVIGGKKALASIRSFFVNRCRIRLSTALLLDNLLESRKADTLRELIANIYQIEA